ncbi:MAG: hypothetical protein ACKPKO_09815, partial [Candidatus Fonsibacter sp.]
MDTHYPFHDNLRRIVQGLQLGLGHSIIFGICYDYDYAFLVITDVTRKRQNIAAIMYLNDQGKD